jgi:hypothetical protein
VPALFVALLVGFPAVGLLARRWGVVLLAVIAWPTYYFGLNKGWWGDETGDAWQVAAVAITIFGSVTTALAVLLARAFASSLARPS